MNVNRDIRILVTGVNGQLGQCIKLASSRFVNFEFSFKNSKDFDITNEAVVFSFFEKNNFDYVINCAAYTNVEKSEKEPVKAFLVNGKGVRNLAQACREHNVKLLHISTDYVFDGIKNTPYLEVDVTNPINEYGKSKLKGEQEVQDILEEYFIIRTSWLYSQFGANFFKTILRKLETEKELRITTSEIGTPTNANDLADFILNIISDNNDNYGIYHYSNLGEVTWYGFAKKIIELSNKVDKVKLEKTANYPTLEKRPKYSVLDKSKIVKVFGSDILEWNESLKKLIVDLKKI